MAAPSASNYPRAASEMTGAAANLAEAPKFRRYKDLIDDEGMEFFPLGVDSYGALGMNARKVLRRIRATKQKHWQPAL